MKSLVISPDLLRYCFQQGAQGYPDEVCGVLTGPADDPLAVTAAHPIPNILNRLHGEDPERYPRTAREGYVLDVDAHFKLERKLAHERQAIRVIYHTHVDVGAYFSKEDTIRALWDGQPIHPGVGYLVCGVKAQAPDGAVIAWFDPATGVFAETRILEAGRGV